MEKKDPDSVEVKFPLEERNNWLHWFFVVLCGRKGHEIIQRMDKDDEGNLIAHVVVELNGVTVSDNFESALKRMFEEYEIAKKREAAQIVDQKCYDTIERFENLTQALRDFLEEEIHKKLGVCLTEED